MLNRQIAIKGKYTRIYLKIAIFQLLEIENVKINWKPLIAYQKGEYLKRYPFPDIERIFNNLEAMLEENRIPSRVLVTNGRVRGFAYLIDNPLFHGRINGYICFPEPNLYSDESLTGIIKWMISTGIQRKSDVAIQDISGAAVNDGVIVAEGFEMLERTGMRIQIPSGHENHAQVPEGFEFSDFSSFDFQEYLDAQWNAYSSTVDSRFLIPENRRERSELLRTVIDGSFGEIIYEASLLARYRGKLAGAILVCSGMSRTDMSRIPLIEDLFVSREFRRRGIGTHLLSRALENLRNASYRSAELAVSSGNPALRIYERSGFIKYGPPERMYLKKLTE